MGAAQSNISAAKYGYDYVVAVTQDSIDAAAQAFLHTRQPMVSVVYVYDDNGDPKRMDYAAFKKAAGGTDPFAVPAAGPDRDAAVKLLDQAGLMFGFQAAMGLPLGFEPAKLPPIVTLGATAGDPVTYRMLCRTFTLVELKQIPHKPPVYVSYAQPVGPAGEPWVFSYALKLVQKPVTDVQKFLTSPTFQALPATAQDRVAKNPGGFSIQQLLIDFAEDACTVRPEITGVSGLLREKLYADFGIEYFTEMQAAGPPMIALVPTGTDPLANLQTEFSVNANPTDPELACLNYLCTTADHPLPPAKPFDWTWVERSEAGDYDGICVVSRRQLANHLRAQLADHVEHNKWVPNPVVVKVWVTEYLADFGVSAASIDWHGDPPANLEILDNSFAAPDGGELVLHWLYKTRREDDWLSGSSWMRGETTFELKVTFSGNQIIVEQHALVYCKLVMVSFWRDEWNLVDLTLTDTFTLSTSRDGKLIAEQKTNTVDNASTVNPAKLVPDLVQRFGTLQKNVKAWVTSAMVDIPLAVLDNVVLPGGRGFLFKQVSFSDHQDLIAHITYADPA